MIIVKKQLEKEDGWIVTLAEGYFNSFKEAKDKVNINIQSEDFEKYDSIKYTFYEDDQYICYVKAFSTNEVEYSY